MLFVQELIFAVQRQSVVSFITSHYFSDLFVSICVKNYGRAWKGCQMGIFNKATMGLFEIIIIAALILA